MTNRKNISRILTDYIASLEKIKELIKNAGMELLAIYDAYTMEPPKEDSGRLTFVVREHGKMAV